MFCASCHAENPADSPYCAVCGAWLPGHDLPPIRRPPAKPDLPIALAFLFAGEFFVRIKSVGSSFDLLDILLGLVPGLIYVAMFLLKPLQERLVDPWLLRVLALVVAAVVLFGSFLFFICRGDHCYVVGL